ncbi:MAG: hypothetical protein PHE83_01665 [Opitutaceae bacterium]|nr:hypothetical protein [Opitutaceae bacterium]
MLYLGGPPNLIAALEPLLKLVSETRLVIATEPRKAAALKLAMNLNIVVMIEGLCEALTWSRPAAGCAAQASAGVPCRSR